MRSLEIKRQMDAVGMDEVSALITDTWRADGARPLNDHLWLDLREGGRQGFAGIIARDQSHSHIVGYCQVSRGNESWSLDLIVHPHHRYDSLEIAPPLIDAAMDVVAREGGGHVHWWVFEPNNIHRQLAERAGLRPGRQLLQMRRPLPLTAEDVALIDGFTTMPFRVGIDETAWLEVNNSAFAHHPEQGGWSLETITSRESEPWFDPSGFLMHWTDGDLAAFCWTKVHDDTDPVMGEIYVIATNPVHRSRGIGRRMAIAGLSHLADRGVPVAMLYVDADNAAAMAVYSSLGFAAHHSERAFVGDVAAATTSP